MKNIFVTGGAGYIGSVCVEQLLNEGYKVAVFDNLSEGHRRAVDPRAVFFQGDLADRDVIRRAMAKVFGRIRHGLTTARWREMHDRIGFNFAHGPANHIADQPNRLERRPRAGRQRDDGLAEIVKDGHFVAFVQEFARRRRCPRYIRAPGDKNVFHGRGKTTPARLTIQRMRFGKLPYPAN